MRALVISVVLLVWLGACRDAGKARAKWTPAGKQWAEQFAAVMPEIMCKDTMYFMSCFAASAADCKRIVKDETNRCLDDHPDVVPREVDADTGRAAGTQIGSCAGSGTERALRAKFRFKGGALCSDIGHWTKVAQEATADLSKLSN